jgi:hypothetical protein
MTHIMDAIDMWKALAWRHHSTEGRFGPSFDCVCTKHVKGACFYDLSIRFWNCSDRVRFWNCSDTVRFWNCSDRVRFWNCSDRVRFWNCSDRVRFWNCSDRVRFWNCSDRVRFWNCSDRVWFFILSIHTIEALDENTCTDE